VKFTKQKREEIQQYVIDCQLMRYSLQQTIDFLSLKSGVKISERMISKIRTRIKRDAQAEFNKLREDNFEYHYQFLQRIQELRKCQQIQYELYENADTDFVRHNCIKEYHALTISLTNLYLDMPSIATIRPNRINGELQKAFQESEQQQQQRYQQPQN
jgi:hypothetical protein